MSQQGYKFCKNIICMGLRRRAENKWQVVVSLHVFRSVLFPQIGWKFRGKLYKYFPRCACKKRKLYFFFLYIFLLITSSFPLFQGHFFLIWASGGFVCIQPRTVSQFHILSYYIQWVKSQDLLDIQEYSINKILGVRRSCTF